MTMNETLNIPQIQQALQEQKEVLTRRLEEAETSMTADNPNRADLAMRAIQNERQGLLAARAEEQLKDIQAALDRIDEGTYGLCETCGQPINPERLHAIPATTVCMKCKQGR